MFISLIQLTNQPINEINIVRCVVLQVGNLCAAHVNHRVGPLSLDAQAVQKRAMVPALSLRNNKHRREARQWWIRQPVRRLHYVPSTLPRFRRTTRGKPSETYCLKTSTRPSGAFNRLTRTEGAAQGRLMADQGVEPYAANIIRDTAATSKEANEVGTVRQVRRGPRDRESRRSRAAQRSGYRSRRFAGSHQGTT